MDIEDLARRGIVLPQAPSPTANYVALRREGRILHLAGNDPIDAQGRLMTGVVGMDIDADAARRHARLVGLNLLAVAAAAAGGLDRVAVVKVFAMVRCTPDFDQLDRVADGCSDLFVEALGERGRHARSVAGLPGLCDGMTVEIEAIMRIADPDDAADDHAMRSSSQS